MGQGDLKRVVEGPEKSKASEQQQELAVRRKRKEEKRDVTLQIWKSMMAECIDGSKGLNKKKDAGVSI